MLIKANIVCTLKTISFLNKNNASHIFVIKCVYSNKNNTERYITDKK